MSSTVTIHQNRLASFCHHPSRGLVELVWTEATADMTDAEFQDQIAVFAVLAQGHRARSLLVDARQFQHKLTGATSAWRERYVTPRYNTAGVERFAFVLASGAELPPAQAAVQGGSRYPTRFFDSHEQALVWLDEPGAEVAPWVEVAVQYRLSDDASIDDIKAGVREFVGAIRAGHPQIEYRSLQSREDERRFLHVIRSASPEALKELQAQGFFGQFAKLLKPACVEGPSATYHDLVASA